MAQSAHLQHAGKTLGLLGALQTVNLIRLPKGQPELLPMRVHKLVDGLIQFSCWRLLT